MAKASAGPRAIRQQATLPAAQGSTACPWTIRASACPAAIPTAAKAAAQASPASCCRTAAMPALRAVYIEGRVFDSADQGTGIAQAHVAASDKTGAVATDVAVTGDNGTYKLQVPVARSDNGPFWRALHPPGRGKQLPALPFGHTPAIPVDAAQAAPQDDGTYVLKNAATDIALIKLPADEPGRKSISGSIILAGDNSTRPGGTLWLRGQPCGLTCPLPSATSRAISRFSMCPRGSWSIRGYKEFLQLTPDDVTHTADADLTGVAACGKRKAYGTLQRQRQYREPADGDKTTVVLVPVSTFSSTFVKGEVPPGLRAPKQPALPSINGAFGISGVPDGYYVVLAAFENDFLVRDPDTSIAGTDIVYNHVPDNVTGSYQINLCSSFKVTGALTIVSPGATEPEQMDPDNVTPGLEG